MNEDMHVPGSSDLSIVEGNLDSDEVAGLLTEHLQDMALHSPPESVHALDIDALKQPEVSFWSGWINDQIVGCIALKHLEDGHAEIKSMRTARSHQRKGIGEQLLQYVLAVAKSRDYRRLSLETGSMQAFLPARTLYMKYGFDYCEPFADYILDSNSVFMSRVL